MLTRGVPVNGVSHRAGTLSAAQVPYASTAARLPGLDVLKAVMIVAVVCIHSTLFYYFAARPFAGMNGWVVLFDVYILIVSAAVPSLLAVSLYLYDGRRLTDPGYFGRRLARVACIIAFWWPSYIVVGWAVGYRGFTRDLVGVLTMPVTDGGLYFLGTLALLTLISEALVRIRERVSARASVNITVLMLVLCYTVVLLANEYLPVALVHVRKLITLGPLMFLPIAPAVFLIAIGPSHGRALAGIATASVAFEGLFLWQSGVITNVAAGVRGNYYVMTYLHPLSSLVATALLCLALTRTESAPKSVELVARNSLGIYLVHILVYPLVARLFARPPFPVQGGLVAFNPFVFLVVAIATGCVVALLQRTPARRFVR